MLIEKKIYELSDVYVCVIVVGVFGRYMYTFKESEYWYTKNDITKKIKYDQNFNI